METFWECRLTDVGESAFGKEKNKKRICRSSILSRRNVCWPRRMLAHGVSRWARRRDIQTDGRTPDRYVTLSAVDAASRIKQLEAIIVGQSKTWRGQPIRTGQLLVEQTEQPIQTGHQQMPDSPATDEAQLHIYIAVPSVPSCFRLTHYSGLQVLRAYNRCNILFHDSALKYQLRYTSDWYTYSQNGSPADGVLHDAPFLQGFGLHDGKPAVNQT